MAEFYMLGENLFVWFRCPELVPLFWLLQFQDQEFGSLSGARIIRIATHPNFQRVSSISAQL